MDISVQKYIKEEKDIASYKLSLLKKGSSKKYKERLISIEEDLIKYPFETLGLRSIEQARDAILKFRGDRATFSSEYEAFDKPAEREASNDEVSILRERLNFFHKKYIDIIDFEIKKINIAENAFIRKISQVSEDSLSSHGIDSLLQMEGAYAAKCRARIQVLMYCLARFIHFKYNLLSTSVYPGVSLSSCEKIRDDLDNFFKNLDNYIYGFYNDGISQVPMIINGTIGHNSFVNSTYPLVNIFEKNKSNLFLSRFLSSGSEFFKKNGSPISKKFVERAFGINCEISRVGNESIELLYADIWSSSGVQVTRVLSKGFFNANIGGSYYKAIATIPVWKWSEVVDNPYIIAELGALIGLEAPGVSGLSCDDPDVRSALKASLGKKVGLDSSLSKALIPATRSEGAHIASARKYIDLVCNDISAEFQSSFL
tara:strand:+ start:872 stop:2155 length:1284 start_codon:yes stop_codon:yes gene_type:complete